MWKGVVQGISARKFGPPAAVAEVDVGTQVLIDASVFFSIR
jgi:hypothetical protein